jgi:hypothetical protein
MATRISRLLIITTVVAIGTLALSDSAFAQCSMCRAGVSQVFARSLNLAVLVLLVPPVSMFAAIFLIAYRRRKG